MPRAASRRRASRTCRATWCGCSGASVNDGTGKHVAPKNATAHSSRVRVAESPRSSASSGHRSGSGAAGRCRDRDPAWSGARGRTAPPRPPPRRGDGRWSRTRRSGRAGIGEVGAGLVAPPTLRHHPEPHGAHRRDPVDHRRVDHLTAARPVGLAQRARRSEEHPPPPMSPTMASGGRGRSPRAKEWRRAGECQVAGVVAGGGREGPCWPHPVMRP